MTKCTICLSKVKDKAKLPCKHVFCHKCIKENQKFSNKCPNCRQVYVSYRHRRKTKNVAMTKSMKDFVSDITCMYLTDIRYRVLLDIGYMQGMEIAMRRFNLIKLTIQLLLNSEECNTRCFLLAVLENMNNVSSINME